MKILIVKLSSIGDVIHTLPALYAIKESLPEAEVSWVVERSAAEILRGNELLTRLIEIDTRSMRKSRGGLLLLPDAWRQLKELRNESVDVAIDLHADRGTFPQHDEHVGEPVGVVLAPDLAIGLAFADDLGEQRAPLLVGAAYGGVHGLAEVGGLECKLRNQAFHRRSRGRTLGASLVEDLSQPLQRT